MQPPQEWVDKINEQRAASGAPPMTRDFAAGIWALCNAPLPPQPLCVVTGI